MNKKILIIGYGSIGQRHAYILKNYFKLKEIYILTKQNCKPFKKINKLSEINNINPDYIIISSQTSKHFSQLNYLEKNFNNKIILVEKPIFGKFKKIIIRKNKVFVGYNMRFNPIIAYIKKIIKGKIIWSVNVICGSYLPDWRKNINYTKSSSANKNQGGGVLLDLSHELDYLEWIFGDLNIEYAKNFKISNLKINTDDYLSLIGSIDKKINLNLSLNYFDKNPIRQIIINGMNININADLIEKKLKIVKKNKFFSKKFSFDRNLSYRKQHFHLLSGNFKNLCTFLQGLKILKLIEKIKKK